MTFDPNAHKIGAPKPETFGVAASYRKNRDKPKCRSCRDILSDQRIAEFTDTCAKCETAAMMQAEDRRYRDEETAAMSLEQRIERLERIAGL